MNKESYNKLWDFADVLFKEGEKDCESTKDENGIYKDDSLSNKTFYIGIGKKESAIKIQRFLLGLKYE